MAVLEVRDEDLSDIDVSDYTGGSPERFNHSAIVWFANRLLAQLNTATSSVRMVNTGSYDLHIQPSKNDLSF